MRRKNISIFISMLLVIFSLAMPAFAQESKHFQLGETVTIYTNAKIGTPLYKSIAALKRDLDQILPAPSVIKSLADINSSGIVVVNSAEDKIVKPITGWEVHRVYTSTIHKRPQVVLQGSDLRGTIFAIYTFSEKIVGVPPLWYYSNWQPHKVNALKIPFDLNYSFSTPTVKYRAWFPNDTDLFAPWRKLSAANNEMWLEAALRLKMNTIEWFDDNARYDKLYSVSATIQLINNYGLINTTHHHSPLNASLYGWEHYWKKIRKTDVPELSLANVNKLEEFWRYNVECMIKNKIDMLWVIGFRAAGDHPFWDTFKDAPKSMKDRGEVINQMMKRQRDLVIELTGNQKTQFRTIFYDELSDLLAQGYIQPPADQSLIWTYVATRRDHYPNKDMQNLSKNQSINLGYYFNYQFTSTGSHLAAGEGPWKMEQNFRYVAEKSNKPLVFAVVNAGNIREFLMELSANADMMWNMKDYNSDNFIKRYTALYFSETHAQKATQLFKDYYHSYWTQKKPDLAGFNRQYIFQDLRYKKAIMDICKAFDKPYHPNPLKDHGGEQQPGRTYRIVPEDNGASSQIEAVINGTTKSATSFHQVTKDAAALGAKLTAQNRAFFNDNLMAPASYMYNLNKCLLNLSQAYKTADKALKKQKVQQAIANLKNAHIALLSTQNGNFSQWYATDRVFGFKDVLAALNKLEN